MMTSTLPPNEEQRLDALRGLNILDTPPEERFDRITRLAQRLFEVPITLISLVDAHRQWFKSSQGLSASETPREISFCTHAIKQSDPMVVPDAALDPRFADNPLVTGDPNIRFYAGYPLSAPDGSRVGTLCLIDQKPRQLTEEELAILRDLGSLAEDEMNALHLQAALIQSEKMAAIGQFSAGVAHDINNPIAVILGYSQSLLNDRPESDRLTVPLKSMEREALRCKTLVQNLLAFSRGQGGKPVMKPEDLNQVIEGALVLVATLARSKQVKLVSPPHREISRVSVDANQLQQVVINLCSNAIDAMPKGGTLTVGLENKRDRVEISVTDTGAGIPPEAQKHIFDAFFTTKDVGKGTGLGLSIVSNIVKTHQGKIDVQTEMGKGTTFLVSLPISLPGTILPQRIAA